MAGGSSRVTVPAQLQAFESALAALTEANERCPTIALERALIDLRLTGFRDMDWPAPESVSAPQPPAVADGQLVEIHARDLNARTLRDAVLGGAGLIVREFIDETKVVEIRAAIDQALEARRRAFEGGVPDGDCRWYSRSTYVKGGPQQFWAKNNADRHRDVGSLWVADSPAAAALMAEVYRRVGLRELLAACFGEPAVLSAKKWVLRKVPPKTEGGSGWHQDGRFLGDGIETVNLWLPLSSCGGTKAAPGMEIVADHRKGIHETGTRGAVFDWVVGPELVEDLAPERPVLSPEFSPGDALFFDHYNLHRTQCSPDQTQLRYAVESWFFAASRAPHKQQPLLF